MTAMAGVYVRDGSAVDNQLFTGLRRAIADAGTLELVASSSASVMMLQRPRRPRPLTQPAAHTFPHGEWLITIDGRIDNMDELRAAIGGAQWPAPPLHTIILAAYRRFGISAFARMLGDFAIALWDPVARELVLATDALGRCPLYYHSSPRLVAWASRSRALLPAVDTALSIDETHVAEFLTNSRITTSPFTSVQYLGGGQVFRADEQESTVDTYWSLEAIPETRHRTDQDYEAHFRVLFEEAVACRLPAGAPVVCELSGGLDSSSIACIAASRLRRDTGDARPLHTVSYVFEEAAHDDEREYIRIVESALGRPGTHVSDVACPLLKRPAPAFAPDVPSNAICFLSRSDRVAELLVENGASALLSGVGGDQLFWSQPDLRYLLADELVQGHVLKLLRASLEWSKVVRCPAVSLLAGSVSPLLPDRWRPVRPMAYWLDSRFVTRAGIVERLRAPGAGRSAGLPTGTVLRRQVHDAMRPNALEPVLTRGHIDVRYPFLDRRLAEFALGIPIEQHVRVGESRSIVRRSLRGLVPQQILDRRTKAGPDESILRAIVREWHWLSPLVAKPRVSELGFVDATRLQHAMLRARHGQSVNTSQLLRTLALELWLRTLDKAPRGESSVPQLAAGRAALTTPLAAG